MTRQSLALAARLLLLVFCFWQGSGPSARAEGTMHHVPGYPLPPDAAQLLIEPYQNGILFQNRAGYLWRLDFGWRDWEGPGRVLRTEFNIRRFPSAEAAEAHCRQETSRTPDDARKQSTTRPLPLPERLKGYDCARAEESTGIMLLPMSGGPLRSGWNTRSHVFSRGPYEVIVYEHAISNDIGKAGPPPAFLARPPIDVIADRLDRLTRGGRPTAPTVETVSGPGGAWTAEEAAAAAAVAASLAALGFSSLASMLLRIRAGLPREPLLARLLDALRGRIPDPFTAWKDKYTRLGWRYDEANGVARFVPVAGSRNEQGWIFDPARNQFVAPAAPPPVDGQVDPATGKVWYGNELKWVSRAYYEQEIARTGRFANQQAAQRAAADAANRAAMAAESAEMGRMAHDIAAGQAALDAAAKARAAQDAALLAKLRKAYEAEGRPVDALDRLAAGGHTAELADLYGEHLRGVIAANSAEAASQARWADAMAVGEYAARATVAAAKTGLMAVGGPAGYGAVMLGSGAIRAAEEGAEALARGGDARHVVKGLATGFVFGAKDGFVGRFANVPGVGAGTRVLMPAAGDAAEIYLRTGDGARALRTGALSAAGGELGGALTGSMMPGRALDAAHVALGGALGAAGQAMEGGSAGQGLVDGLFNGLGSVAGGQIASANAPMTAVDIQMDREAAAAMGKGHALIEDFARARTPQEKAEAVNRLLENHAAKLLMKNDDNYPTLKEAFAAATQDHRTEPLLAGASESLNRRYGVMTVDESGQPVLRDVTPADFQSGSSSAKQPGMDLDLFTDARIVDRAAFDAARQAGKAGSLRPAGPEVVTDAVNDAARGLGIDPHGQEINVIDPFHPEALAKPADESLRSFLRRPGSYSGSEAQSVSEVTGYKLTHADGMEGGSGMSLVETCRTGFKDYNRFTRPMLDSHPDASLPAFLRQVDGTSGRSGLDIIKAVGDGTLSPGTGNAQFRALTGMELDDGVQRMAGMPEAIAKLGSAGAGPGKDLSVTFVINDGRAIAQGAVRDALRSVIGDGGP